MRGWEPMPGRWTARRRGCDQLRTGGRQGSDPGTIPARRARLVADGGGLENRYGW